MSESPVNSQKQSSRDSKIALLLVLMPNLILIGVGLLMRGQAQHVAEV
jgi:hypothetical protein